MDITLTGIQALLATIVSIIGSLMILSAYIKKWLEKDIKELDKQQTMDFLIMEFARAERHELTDAEKLHLKARYDHYIMKPEDGGLGGNSYIKETYEKLKGADRL